MRKFTELNSFAIISSLRRATPAGVLSDMRDSERKGADGFLLHAQLLAARYRTAECIGALCAQTDLPVMVINYRTKQASDDVCLNALKREAVRAGAAAADLPANSFAPAQDDSLMHCPLPFAKESPAEVSVHPDALARQSEWIRQIHDAGAEVLMSAHVGKFLSPQATLSLAQEMIRRDADIAKIIVSADNAAEAAKVYETAALLHTHLHAPFLYQCAGAWGKLIRPTAWMFGSCMILCHNRYSTLSNREKPLIRDVQLMKEKFYREDMRI